MKRWLIRAQIITTLPDGTCATEDVECEVEALSYVAACSEVRERLTSPYAAVWIDHERCRKVAA